MRAEDAVRQDRVCVDECALEYRRKRSTLLEARGDGLDVVGRRQRCRAAEDLVQPILIVGACGRVLDDESRYLSLEHVTATTPAELVTKQVDDVVLKLVEESEIAERIADRS